MAAAVRIAISIPKALYDQAESLAQKLSLSRSALFGMAMESFLRNSQGRPLSAEAHPNQPGVMEGAGAAGQNRGERRAIQQGDIYWVPLAEPDGSEPGNTHPQVVVQEDVFNHSRIHTVVVCALTSNLKRAGAPGNVLLEAGEANLPRQSVVEISKISSVDKTQLGEYVGSLDERRMDQVLAGMRFLQRMSGPRQ
jgi:mRNA interferase MazF